MATGSPQNISESRAEALQALFNSISGSSSSADSGGQLSEEHAGKLSSRLDELLGEDVAGEALAQAGQVRRNEKGEVLNEEGLPIIEITEPVELSSEALTSAPLPQDDLPLNPAPPPPLTAAQKARMERILDILEAEEAEEESRASREAEEARKREIEARKENAKKDLERLRKAKEMQRKMGKALIRNVEEARERERKEKEEQEREYERADRERREVKAKGPKKKVSFAELPTVQSPDTPQGAEAIAPQEKGADGWGDVFPAQLKPAHAVTVGKQTMKLQVVERFPSASASSSRPRSTSPPPPPQSSAEADSDDESRPSSPIPVDSDEGDPIVQDADVDQDAPIQAPSSDDEEDEIPEDEVVDDEFDFDTAQHQREIALEYYKKRSTMGEDAARALSAHTHEAVGPNGEPIDEWDQPDVPLEATLSSKQTHTDSRFKRSYNTTLPRSTPSQSLGASILPSTSSSTSSTTQPLAHAIRTGKLDENDKLVAPPWVSDDEDMEDFGDEEENANARRWLKAMRSGEVENVGATMEERSDALVKALEAAYGAPEKSKDSAKVDDDGERTAVATPTLEGAPSTSTSAAAAPPATATETKPKTSKFKLARMPPRTVSSLASATDSESGTPTLTEGRSSPKLPTSPNIVERKPALATAVASSVMERRPNVASSRTTMAPSVMERKPTSIGSTQSTTPPQTQPQFSVVVDSPSFQAPGSSSPTVIDSSSFTSPAPAPSSSVAPPTSQSTSPPPSSNQPPLMIIDSPSFMPSTGARPSKPPVVMSSTVRESSGSRGSGESVQAADAGAGDVGALKKVSRFRAERS